MLVAPVSKLAAADHEILELLRVRWSPRAFESRPISRADLLPLLEAARWAPSSFNEQPWRFIIAVRDQPEPFQRMLSCLIESNRAWARGAGALMLSVAKLTFDRDGAPNRHAFHDVGLAVASLIVQATEAGIAAHQMAGFDVDTARTLFEIPDGFEPIAAIALGYPGDPDTLSERNRVRERAPRERRPIADFAFSGRWGGVV